MSTSRPKGFVLPPTQFHEAKSLIDSSSWPAAAASLEKVPPSNDLDHAWTDYLRALIQFGQNQIEDGLASSLKPYSRLKAMTAAPSSDLVRVVAAALKKAGWAYRKNKDYERAYAVHQIEYEYYDQFGSFEELHDAAISLDVDAFSMGDARLDERWLRKSIVAAEGIPEEVARQRCLGMSYNNLAGALYSQAHFPESEKVIFQALDHWKSYEAKQGTSEFKVAWAWFGVGDVYENWMKAGSADKKQKAQEAYQKALELGTKQGMSAADLKTIRDQIAGL